jgi:hypothetical protein
MTTEPSEFDDEMAAWTRFGMENVRNFLESIHDHGYIEIGPGDYVSLPSGKVGEICKTCGKLIEPIEIVLSR